MSFASETKKELTNLEVKDCCGKAELSALNPNERFTIFFESRDLLSTFKQRMLQLLDGFIR